jgi:hypothetical protein
MSSPQQQALAVLERFIEANRQRDEAALAACLTQSTLDSGQFSGANPQMDDVTIGEVTPHGEGFTIAIHPPAEMAEFMPPLPAVMVIEDGEWKLDLVTSMALLMGSESGMDDLVDEMFSAMGEAIGGVMGAMGDAVSSAFANSDEDPDSDAPDDHDSEGAEDR